jgi:hypothetical protein
MPKNKFDMKKDNIELKYARKKRALRELKAKRRKRNRYAEQQDINYKDITQQNQVPTVPQSEIINKLITVRG